MLNAEQQKFTTDNHNLIFDVAHKYHINLEENYGVLAIALCRAVENYDESKGAFSTFAFTLMYRDYLKEVDAKKYQKRDGVTCEYSDELTPTYQYMDDTIEILDCLNEKEQIVAKLKARGYTNLKIAEVIGHDKVHVSRILKSIRKKLKEELGVDR